MRRSAKWFGFMVVASLLVGACGGDDSSTTDNSTADASTSDTTAEEDDRDRNVKVGGWGTDGSGIARSVIRENNSTRYDTKAFRRARSVEVDGVTLINTRDFFVTVQEIRERGAATSASIIVAGFDTSLAPADSPIPGFGTNGVVRVSLADHGPDWATHATSWTVVSRDLLAVYFNSNLETGPIGMVEYYDLRTGEVDKTIGTNGKTLVPAEPGMSWVMSFGLRMVASDGTPHFVIAGPQVNTDGETTDIYVAGFTPDGIPDPMVGDAESGKFSIADRLPDAGEYETLMITLVDAGVNYSVANIGLVVQSNKIGRATDGKFVPRNDALTVVMAKPDETTGIISSTSPMSFATTWEMDRRFTDVKNALASSDSVLVHVASSPLVYDLEADEDLDRELLVTFSEARHTPVRLSDPRWSAGVPYGSFIKISEASKDFVVQLFVDQEEKKYVARVCFNFVACADPERYVTIQIGVVEDEQDMNSELDSFIVTEAGPVIAVKNSKDRTGDYSFAMINVDTNGSRFSKPSASFETLFDHYNFNENDELTTYVGDPMVLDNESLASYRYQSANKTHRIVTERVGDQAVETDVSTKLGLGNYSANSRDFARIDERSVAMVVYVVNEDGEERRIFKIDTANGSVDTEFGGSGYVTAPKFVADDGCAIDRPLISGPGTITDLTLDYDSMDLEDPFACGASPVEMTWRTFTTAGAPVGDVVSRADVAALNLDDNTKYIADNKGNLFVVRDVAVYDENGEVARFDMRVTKFLPSGEIDETYGAQGEAILENPPVTYEVRAAVDAESRVYLGYIYNSNSNVVTIEIARFTASGTLDVAQDVAAPATTLAPQPGASSPADKSAARREQTVADKELAEVEAERRQTKAADAALPSDNGVTVLVDGPVLSSVVPSQDRSLTVTWTLSSSGGVKNVVATAMPGGRSCASTTRICVIRGLDPTIAYTVTVGVQGGEPSKVARSTVVPTKPVVSLKVGRVASPTTFVRPASKGKATWKVRGGCKLNETNTRITAPKSPTTCQLSVTTAKSGSTPKTTKSVTIVVKK